MSDAVTKAEQLRVRAKECVRIAYFATDAKQRTEYQRMAFHYRELAEVEEILAGLALEPQPNKETRDMAPRWPAKDR